MRKSEGVNDSSSAVVRREHVSKGATGHDNEACRGGYIYHVVVVLILMTLSQLCIGHGRWTSTGLSTERRHRHSR